MAKRTGREGDRTRRCYIFHHCVWVLVCAGRLLDAQSALFWGQALLGLISITQTHSKSVR